ncbi:MAG: YceI family protein [Bacteroidetes bacterium]|nr:MAG: YceI family protein [Bacteroidota bacterium]
MKLMFMFLLLMGAVQLCAQRYATSTAKLSFFSASTLENIEAVNSQGICVIDAQTSALEFQAMLKGFEFKKALMQQHFNEDYVESDVYPKVNFKGKIKNAPKLWTKDGEYDVTVEGQLTLHGVTKSMVAPGKISIKNGVVSASAKFDVAASDFNIKIPASKKNNINNTVQVNVNISSFKLLKAP